MFVIIGFRGVTRNVAEGEFTCPSCRSRRGYRRKHARRYFTIFLIPIIPLDSLGEWVECKTCGGTFKPAILEPRFQQQVQADDHQGKRDDDQFRSAVHDVMLLVALADGGVDSAECSAISQALTNLSGQDVTADAVRVEAARFSKGEQAVSQELLDLAGQLSDHSKLMLCQAANMAATANGRTPTAAQSALLGRITALLATSRTV